MIESDYSQEFTEQSMTSKDISQSNTRSANKLLAKAKDIEESGYSENFEEDSMARSATKDGAGSASKDKLQMMMEAVKEESLDDSANEMSKDITQSVGSTGKKSRSSRHTAAEKMESSLGSLPSEDITVQDSARSVDWKIDIPQDSERRNAEESEEQS